jgi:hypothetical protein
MGEGVMELCNENEVTRRISWPIVAEVCLIFCHEHVYFFIFHA